MRYQPDFTLPEVPLVFKTVVNDKNQKNQDAITGEKQKPVICLELVSIKRLQENNDKGQIDT